jgi:phosphinothricin acetyltransferase
MIRSCATSDAKQICAIYNHYVRTTVVTFEEESVSEDEMIRRIVEIRKNLPWLVWEEDARIPGYAYAASWKLRAAYRLSVEATVYVEPSVLGRGLGTQLYRALIAELKERGIHAVVGGIALPNDASIALHERLGFEKIGQFREIGWKLGKWVDVGYWELLLSRDESRDERIDGARP